jgi:hypothetical protein
MRYTYVDDVVVVLVVDVRVVVVVVDEVDEEVLKDGKKVRFHTFPHENSLNDGHSHASTQQGTSNMWLCQCHLTSRSWMSSKLKSSR